MTTPNAAAPKYRHTLMMSVYIALAAWGGWGLARMGEDRSRAKAESESDRISGTGEVKERETKPVPSVPVEAPAIPLKTPEVVVEKPAPAKPVEPAPVVESPPAPVGPPVLIVRTVPLAEVWVTDETGTRPVGLADATGGFTLGTLPAGECWVEVRHVDLRPMASPLAVTLKAGETVERLIVPETKPGSLILLTDEGVVAHLDGKKVGGYAVMLGSVPSRRELPLKLVLADGTSREETVKLAPRENRLLDLRSPAKAKGDVTPEGIVSNIPNAEPAAKAPSVRAGGTPALPVAAPAKLAVRVISAATDTGLVAFSAEGGGAAPLAMGATASLALSGLDSPVKLSCVRTFGGVSVCKAVNLPAIATPVAGELTK